MQAKVPLPPDARRGYIMGRRLRAWDHGVYERYLKNGRGQGEGAAYIPWITIHDFSSRGIVTRVFGHKTQRTHHFLSRNELLYFYLLEWSDDVLDIREQYPLIDVEQAVAAAAEAGIRYPSDSISGFPYILTCDFLITTQYGLKARTIKESASLQNKRTLEKLEIERRYWKAIGIDWAIITEKGIPVQRARNIEWLHTSAHLPKELDQQHLQVDMLQISKAGRRSKFLAAFEKQHGLAAGSALNLYKHLLWTKQICCDMDSDMRHTYH